jgi:hypothetical protein
MRSLYLGYPVGSLLTWETDASNIDTRGSTATGSVQNLLLDGQQRITSLYGVVRGKPPEFFEGDPKAFSGLHFHIDDEVFEFYATSKMKGDVAWVDVTALLKEGLTPFISQFMQSEVSVAEGRLTRLTRLHNVLTREFHLEKITGPDKTTDVVVDIFNRVNSGGTKLSKGDLALAKMTAQSVSARQAMRDAISDWHSAGYPFKLDWLLRNVTVASTGRVLFRELDRVDAATFEASLKTTKAAIGHLLDVVAGRLGLDHGRVLLGSYGFPVLVRYLLLNGGKFPSQSEQDKALFWLVHAGIWGRFSGSTETVLTQDLDALDRRGLDGLIDNISRSRGGSLTIQPVDFTGSSMGSRFYPLLYMLTRVSQARDLRTGVPLHSHLLGHNSSLQVHHLFPKAQLYAMEPPTGRSDVNAVANFAFLTQDSNIQIGKRLPEEYLKEAEQTFPGVLGSQWIPQDDSLWGMSAYMDFLAARRVLLADAANSFLDSLLTGGVTETTPLPRIGEARDESPDGEESESFAAGLRALRELGMAEPLLDAEVADPDSGEIVAVAEALWPDGLQVGRGSPIVVDVDGTRQSLQRLESLGYVVFTSLASLVALAQRESAEDSGDVEASGDH